MPLVLHPCSSSPIRSRSGSAESVVLPVPERPKNNAVSPFLPTLAEQCIGNTLFWGNRKFITPKIDFFISPLAAARVFRSRTVLRSLHGSHVPRVQRRHERLCAIRAQLQVRSALHHLEL